MADIDVSVSVTGADAASRDLQRVGDAAKSTGEQSALGGLKLQQLSGSMGQLSGALGQINPQFGELGRVLASGVGQMGAMASSGAVLGASIGALTTAFSLVTRAIKDSEDAMRAAEQAAIAAAPTFDRIYAQIQRQEAESARIRRMGLGQGSSAEYGAQGELLRQQERDLRAAQNGDVDAIRRLRASGLGNAGHERTGVDQFVMSGIGRVSGLLGDLGDTAEGIGAGGPLVAARGALHDIASQGEIDRLDPAEIERARSRIARLRRDQSQNAALAALAEANRGVAAGVSTAQSALRGGRRGGGSRRSDAADTEGPSAATEDPFAMQAAITNKQNESADIQAGVDSAANSARADRERRAMQKEQDYRRQQLSQEREWYAERKRQRDDYYDSWSEKASVFGEALGSVFEQVASGQSSVLEALSSVFKQTMAQLAKSEAVEAIKETAKGFAAIAIGDAPSASNFFTAAGLHAAAAAAAGGAGAAVSAATSSGSSRGGASNARPTRVAGSGGGGSREDATVVVNLNAPSISAGTDAELGRTIQRAVRHGEHRFGWGEGGTA